MSYTLFIISINSRINISECVCAIFGLILNTISVIILSKLIQIDRRNKSERKIIYYLLVALAVFDNFYLSSVILKETTLWVFSIYFKSFLNWKDVKHYTETSMAVWFFSFDVNFQSIQNSERPKVNFTETEPKPKLNTETRYIVVNTWWLSQITTNSIVIGHPVPKNIKY